MTMNISFEAIRKQMEAATGTVAQAATTTSSKIVEGVKSVASAVGSAMPASNAKLDDRTEKLVALIEEQGLQMDNLYAALGLPKPVIPQASLDALIAARMEQIKAKPVKEEAPAPAPVVAPQIALSAPVATEPHQLTLDEVATITQPSSAPSVAPAPAPSAPPAGIPMSQPTNWHMGPVI
jgi:hypothetical protein